MPLLKKISEKINIECIKQQKPCSKECQETKLFQKAKINCVPKNLSKVSLNKINNVCKTKSNNQKMPCINTEIKKRLQTTETTKSTQVESSKPTQSSKIESSKPAQVESSKPTQVESSKPTQVESSKPTQVESSKPTQVESSKPTQIESSKPTQIESSKPTQVESSKTTQVESSKPTQSSKVESSKLSQSSKTVNCVGLNEKKCAENKNKCSWGANKTCGPKAVRKDNVKNNEKISFEKLFNEKKWKEVNPIACKELKKLNHKSTSSLVVAHCNNKFEPLSQEDTEKIMNKRKDKKITEKTKNIIIKAQRT